MDFVFETFYTEEKYEKCSLKNPCGHAEYMCVDRKLIFEPSAAVQPTDHTKTLQKGNRV